MKKLNNLFRIFISNNNRTFSTSNFSGSDINKLALSNKNSILYNNSAAFQNIKYILNSDLNYHDKQLKIEQSLREFWKLELESLFKTPSFTLSNSGLRMLIDQIKLLRDDISDYLHSKKYTRNKKYIEEIKELEPSLILSIILSQLIPFCFRYGNFSEQPVTTLFQKLGLKLYKEARYSKYNSLIKNNKFSSKISFNEFVSGLPEVTLELSVELGSDMISLISLKSDLFKFKELNADKQTSRYIIPSDGIDDFINHITLFDSEELPMIINPEKWVINNHGEIIKYGGYLSNNSDINEPLLRFSVENVASKHIKVNSSIINLVNKFSSVPYCINKEVLHIILEPRFSKILDLKNSFHAESSNLNSYIEKKNFTMISEITSYNSKFLYEKSILSIAQLLVEQAHFYFPMFIDWRGRLYAKGGPLNFQGGELARSLLLFKNGEILTEKGLEALKIYGANAFGLDKKSKAYRLEWFNQNLNDILGCPENEFWAKAEEPCIFLAVALEFKSYYKDPLKFKSRLPILLDATCSGLQHLAAMAQDLSLAENVNLLNSNDSDPPRDIYAQLLEPIKREIHNLVDKHVEFSNLLGLNLDRKFIKRGIMTISYGVTPRGIAKQLINDHFNLVGLHNGRYIYSPKESKYGTVHLNRSDIFKLSEIIYNSLFKVHPLLDELVNYFNQMVKLLNKLDLPVVWITPSGLHINQKYVKFTKYDIVNSVLGKRKKITLRKPDLNKLNGVKQVNAFVPNFIHSMDAANIALLSEKLYLKSNFNILTIHDCFGTTANNVQFMSLAVKESFISIYAGESFISNFHDFVLNYISLNYEVNELKTHVLPFEDEPIKIPNKPKIGFINLKENLLKSLYFIN